MHPTWRLHPQVIQPYLHQDQFLATVLQSFSLHYRLIVEAYGLPFPKVQRGISYNLIFDKHLQSA